MNYEPVIRTRLQQNLETGYEPVIGLEVHVELNTKTKMFCGCSADYFGKEPNSHTCPVCLGLPGALPVINKEAIQKCIMIGLALNCSVAGESLFERKNYFYPDLSKGYQISQYRWPLTINGFIEVEDFEGKKSKIRINRAHQEEDTGKLTHKNGETLIDFNRSGVPLVEIVTEPDFTDSSQIRDYAKKLQQIFRYLGVSNADMERGDMRLEANVSVRRVGDSKLPPYRVELKNINSFRFMVAACEFEINRQIKLYEEGKGDELKQETRGWDEVKRETYLQRSKEEANDYRYFPEPDLPVITTRITEVKKLQDNLPELPSEKGVRFTRDFKIKPADAKVLTETIEMANFFERLVEIGKSRGIDPVNIANYVINQKSALLNSTDDQIIDDLIAKNSGTISDMKELEELCKEVIKDNKKAVDDYKGGKFTAIQVLIGAVMKKSSGKADSGLTRQIFERLLK